MLSINKKRAFTLAEVLITLGIVGVLSAMTIPTLSANVTGAKYKVQFKKTLTTLNHAGLMAQTQYGFNYADIDTVCADGGEIDNPNEVNSICSLLNGTLSAASYIKKNRIKLPDGITTYADGVDIDASPNLASINVSDYVYVLADGAIVALPFEPANCSVPVGMSLTNEILTTYAGFGVDDERVVGLAQCLGYIDVNGTDYPNREVICSGGEETSLTPEAPCKVKNNPNDLTDIFPIVFHDASVEPASNAAKFLLSTTK